MIQLFNIQSHKIDTSKFSNLLHDKNINILEQKIASFVGAKYAVSFNSATNAIFLSLLNKDICVNIPSMIPPVVLNAIITSGNKYKFVDNTKWIGDSYILHEFSNYRIIDSAQKIHRNQFINECNNDDLMIFSFYPTKPIGGCDGGMIVSNDFEKINYLRELSFNGMTNAENNWDRKIKFPGYKMYLNSLQAEIVLNNFNLYENKLKTLNNIKNLYNNLFNLNNNSDHLYRIKVNDRKKFMNIMKENKISCGIHYSAMHLNSVYSQENTSCINSEIESELTVSIPFHENLSEKDCEFVFKTAYCTGLLYE
jgi:dTDP-4-amino-4,6-dideoxygalactose transaminase